jgi:acetylornithine deacetylase/succinyl-diaminopimelate desuccinylase-like protein
MIFVPSKKGISHSPLEWTDPGEICLGAEILLEAIVRAAHAES